MQEKQKSIFKEWWFYFIVVVFLVVIYLIVPKPVKSLYSNMDEFAQCLTDNNVKMYGTEWCPHCKNQKALFGSSFKNINYIDCDLKHDECLAALVAGYPTWNVDGVNHPGEQSLEVLSQATGCQLVKN